MYGNATTRQNSMRLFTISRNFANWDYWKLVRVALWRSDATRMRQLAGGHTLDWDRLHAQPS